MTENIFIPMMIVSPIHGRLFSSYILNVIKDTPPPDGIKIVDIRRGHDPVLEYTFDKVKRQNTEGISSPDFSYEEDNYLRIEVETESSIRYQNLDWIDELIKKTVKEYDDSVGIYFFYLISEDEFKEQNIMKVIGIEETTYILDDRTDDWAQLQAMSSFINLYFYQPDESSLPEEFPALTALMILLFG